MRQIDDMILPDYDDDDDGDGDIDYGTKYRQQFAITKYPQLWEGGQVFYDISPSLCEWLRNSVLVNL